MVILNHTDNENVQNLVCSDKIKQSQTYYVETLTSLDEAVHRKRPDL